MATGMLRATTNSAKSFEPRNPKSRGCPSKARGAALFLCAKAAHGSAQACRIPRSTFRYRVERYGKTDPHAGVANIPFAVFQPLAGLDMRADKRCGLLLGFLSLPTTPAYSSWTGKLEFFRFVLYYGEKSKIPNAGAKNFPLTYYYNRQGAKWPGMEPGNKKAANLFQTYCFRWPRRLAVDIQF